MKLFFHNALSLRKSSLLLFLVIIFYTKVRSAGFIMLLDGKKKTNFLNCWHVSDVRSSQGLGEILLHNL